jgi:ankyrin repeat protein
VLARCVAALVGATVQFECLFIMADKKPPLGRQDSIQSVGSVPVDDDNLQGADDTSILDDYFKEQEYWPPTVWKLPLLYTNGWDAMQTVRTNGKLELVLETPSTAPENIVGLEELSDDEKKKFEKLGMDGASTAGAQNALTKAGSGVQEIDQFRRFIRDKAASYLNLLDHMGSGEVDDERFNEKILNHNSKAICGHNDERSLYFEIRSLNLVALGAKYLAKKSIDFTENMKKEIAEALYDDNGATVVHQCFQYQRYDMVKWLVRTFPEFSLRPYRVDRPRPRSQDASLVSKIVNSVPESLPRESLDPELEMLPYGDQNLLHMAVLAKNQEFIRWLLDFYSKYSDKCLFKLVTQRVVTKGSTYFRRTGNHYYGETPLHFAICMNDYAMVDLILSFVSLLHTELLATDPTRGNERTIRPSRNLLFMPDCNGNNAIHLCVLHNLPSMYDHLKYIALEMIRQELMREYHKAVSLLLTEKYLQEQVKYPPVAINYEDFYGDQGDRYFTPKGYIRNMPEVVLPSLRVRQRFFDVQAAKLVLESLQLKERNRAIANDEVIDFIATEVGRNYKRIEENVSVLLKLNKNVKSSDWLKDCIGIILGPEVTSESDRPANTQARKPESTAHNNSVGPRRSSIVDKRAGGLNDSRSFGKVVTKMFNKFLEYDWDEWFEGREGELKQAMRQWLYGTDIGLKDGAVHRIYREVFMLGLNYQGHCAATLAAARGKAAILRHLIRETVISRDRNYDFDLTAIEFPLIQCDDDRNAYTPKVPPNVLLRGAIWWICRNEQNNKLLDEIPEIRAVIAAKWERVGSMIGYRNHWLHLAFLVPVVLLTCLATENGSEFSKYKVNSQWSTYLLAFCFAIFLAVVIVDAGSLVRVLVGVEDADAATLVKLFGHSCWTFFVNRNPVQAPSSYRPLLPGLAAESHVSEGQQHNASGTEIEMVNLKEVKAAEQLDGAHDAPPSANSSEKTASVEPPRSFQQRLSWNLMLVRNYFKRSIKVIPILWNRRPVGAGLFDFCLRVVIAGTFLAIVVVRLCRNEIRNLYHGHYVDTMYCTLIGGCCLCTLVYSFLFLALNNENDFGTFLVTVTRILLKDFFYFASFWFRIVVMFGLALKTITDDIDGNGFVHAFRCIWALIRLSFNGVPTNEFEPLARQHQFESVWFSFLMTFFCLFVNIMIINLLIAVMSNTYNEYSGKNALGKPFSLLLLQCSSIIL